MAWIGALALALIVTACGDEGGGSARVGETVSAAPAPSEMCDGEEAPALAAYARRDGELKWVVCSADQVRHDVVAASDEVVHLHILEPVEPTVVAYDVTDGTERPSVDPPPDEPTGVGATPDGRSTIDVDDMRIEGGQDDPTTGVDASTGEVVWTQPGSPAYDDVWAVGDGAVFVIDRRSDPRTQRLVAYEVESGEERWALEGIDPYGAELGWPWHVEGDVLFTIWSNLALVATDDGSTLWRTGYPVVEFPRMTGVRANDDTVFVAFSSIRSSGD